MTKPQAPIFQRRPDLAEAAEAAERARKEARRAQVQRTPQMESADLPAQAEPVVPSLVTPLSVFAAGRSNFDCIVRGPFSGSEALAVIFSRLPMEEYGWEYSHTAINRAGHAGDFPIWRVSRKPSFMADPATQAQQQPASPFAETVKGGGHQVSGVR